MRPPEQVALRQARVRAEWVMEQARVLAHDGDGEIHKLTLAASEVARRATAGQFVEIHPVARHPGGTPAIDPLLRRPLSLCEIRPEAGEVSLVYRVVGRGTRALAALQPGDTVDLLGPLGHSFPAPAAGRGRLLLIGGGLGIPPMAAAARWAVQAGRPALAILGARSARYLAGAREVEATGVEVITVTDDGSAGQRGLVTDVLDRLLVGTDRVGGRGAGVDTTHAGEVWACGPEPMLVAVKERCAAAGVPCFVSVERFMACGFGACLGCTVPRAGGGYLKTCQDGPVFPAEEVVLGGF
ncbi:dihydroorotate dehydrogenase electron transfer subunit [Symbiobacterium terraclitae]|uniref:dihydroorotate dehydrogenase electron transfer subunit n=1 Tax=Symbiobacterium terraclitae TaxID=557451 RepID=UPI0035B503DB